MTAKTTLLHGKANALHTIKLAAGVAPSFLRMVRQDFRDDQPGCPCGGYVARTGPAGGSWCGKSRSERPSERGAPLAPRGTPSPSWSGSSPQP